MSLSTEYEQCYPWYGVLVSGLVPMGLGALGDERNRFRGALAGLFIDRFFIATWLQMGKPKDWRYWVGMTIDFGLSYFIGRALSSGRYIK